MGEIFAVGHQHADVLANAELIVCCNTTRTMIRILLQCFSRTFQALITHHIATTTGATNYIAINVAKNR